MKIQMKHFTFNVEFNFFSSFQHGTCPICRKLLNDNSQDSFSTTNLQDTFMSDASTTNQESSQTTSASENEDLSSVSRNFNSHQSSVYDFTDEFD